MNTMTHRIAFASARVAVPSRATAFEREGP